MTRYRTIATAVGAGGDQTADDRQFVVAVERGLRLLRAFTSSRALLSNAELARQTGLSKPTISRLTYTLVRLGYLTYERDSGLYRLGASSLALGHASFADLDARQIARPLMQELAEYAPGGVILSACSGLNMICLEIRRSPKTVGLGLEVGDRMPIAETAPGRAYLAALTPEKREAILLEVRRANPAGWSRMQRGVQKSIAEFADKGFCATIGDWYPEINSVAVLLKSDSPYGRLAINIGGLASALPAAKIEKDLGPRLVALAQRIDDQLQISQTPKRSTSRATR